MQDESWFGEGSAHSAARSLQLLSGWKGKHEAFPHNPFGQFSKDGTLATPFTHFCYGSDLKMLFNVLKAQSKLKKSSKAFGRMGVGAAWGP